MDCPHEGCILGKCYQHNQDSPSASGVMCGPTTHGRSCGPVTTIVCANDAEVLDGLLGALDPHEFIFGRPMELADALGCM